MRPQVGQVINNKYRLVRTIGDGGMGSVYEARHEVLGTTVALKFLHPELSRRQGLVQRFLQEARVSAQIKSPHVVGVVDVDQTSTGQAFIVMEFIEGKTLQTLYEELYHAGQRLSYADALEYAMQMLDGVDAAHRAGVVHRDLKPDNVMITRGPKGETLLKLLDFGIAKLKVTGQLDRGLTRPGVIMGTPEYMAPEQAYSADAVDARADIFSLGVMIFEMLAGRRPVGGDEPQQIASAYITGQIDKLAELAPHVPPELAAVVHKAMAGTPEGRYGSVAELRAALEPFAVAVRAPSVLATPAPTGITPAPAASPAPMMTPPSGQAGSAIPKTLPPTDDGPPPGVEQRPMATPLGGFASPATPATPGPGGAYGTSIAEPLPQGLATPGPGRATAAGMDGRPSYGPAARAGGTAVAMAPIEAGAGGYPAVLPGGYPAAPGGYPAAPGGGYGAAPMGTAPMDPVGAQPRTGGQKKKGGLSVAGILGLAAVVTGVVIGGIYVTQQLTSSSNDSGGGPIVQAPPTTVVPSDPQTSGGQTNGAATGAVQSPPTPTPPVTHAGGGTSSGGKVTTGGGTTPQPTSSTSASTPTGFPTAWPTALPPLPSGMQIPLPFPFPGQQQQPSTTTGGGTSNPPSGGSSGGSQPEPTSTGRPRIRIPVPGQNP
jgi:serine/threonine-protein kinase